MAVEVEPKPQLTSPEYWGGVDISNPDHFVDLTDRQEFTAGRLKRFRAARALLRGVASVAASEGGNDENMYTQWFEPTVDELSNGSLVIIERERLVAGFGDHSGLVSGISKQVVTDDSYPISKPFSSNWVNAQASGSSDCGEEHAIFPDRDMVHIRTLIWGVLTSNMAGERGIITWQFSDPEVRDHDTIEVVIPEADEIAEPLPLAIGVSRAHVSLDNTDYTVRQIERNRSVVIVRGDEESPGKFYGGRQKLKSLRDRVEEALAEKASISPSSI